MTGYVIGVDIGGTNIVCGIVDPDGAVIANSKFPTAPARGAMAILEQIASEAKALVNQEGLSWQDVDAVGIGVPGLVDPVRGISIGSVNLGWKYVNVAEIVGQLLGKPIAIDNDFRMYIYGEAVIGAGKGSEHILGVTIGTGIASAFVSKGVLHHGSGHLAGEIGHISVDGENHLCKCGTTGCLETVVSAPGIARRYGSSFTAAEVAAACSEGDALAIKVMEHAGSTLGKVLSYIVPALSPDMIVVGGGVAAAGDPLLIPMRRELYSRVQPFYRERFRIVPAILGDNAGVIGSAMFARYLLRKSDG